MEDEAEGGAIVIGYFGALVGGEGGGGIGSVRGDDSEVVGGEKGAETIVEGESDIFFDKVVGEARPGVGASVSGVEEDEGAGGGCLGRRWSLGEGCDAAEAEQERDDELLAGRSQEGSGAYVVDCNWWGGLLWKEWGDGIDSHTSQKREVGTGITQGQVEIYFPTHRKKRDGWGTRAFVAGRGMVLIPHVSQKHEGWGPASGFWGLI
jgi:hypothetical protein